MRLGEPCFKNLPARERLRGFIMNNKIIINFCPTGMLPTKAMTPNVPITPQEIIEQTHEAYDVGITIVHLHARDENEMPSWEPKIYQEIFEGVRKYCPDLIVCGSTSGRSFAEFEKRSAVIELKPDMCSLTLSSLNFMNQASTNPPDMIQALAQKMKQYGVKPEFECFDFGMINYGLYMIKKGFVDDPFYWNLFFGNIAGFQANMAQIGLAVREIPADNHFIALAGLAGDQLPVNAYAIAGGYGVRVGLEDNIWFDAKRTTKATNIALLTRIHELLRLNDKEILTAKEFGKLGFYNGK